MKRSCYKQYDMGQIFGLAVGVMLVAQLLLTSIFYEVGTYTEINFDDPSTLPVKYYDWAFWTMQALYALCIGSTAFLYAKITKTDVVKATTLNQAPPLAHVGWGCLSVLFLIASMTTLNGWILDLIEKCGLPRPSVDMPQQIVPMLLVACLLPSFTEEVVFRGSIAMSCKGNKNKLGSLAVCGALFALFHLNAAQTLHQFVLGAFLALLVLRSGSVWTAIIVHFFNNAVAVVLNFTVSDEAVFMDKWWLFLPIGLIGFALSVFGYLSTIKSRWSVQEEDLTEEEQLLELATSKEKNKFSLIVLSVSVIACAALWIFNLVSV